jgi:hypothetical protein
MLFVGLLLATAATLLAVLVTDPPLGHKIDIKALPVQAQAVLNENPREPISPEQWERLDRIMKQHGGWPSGSRLTLASVRSSWYWFLVLPLLFIAGTYLATRSSPTLAGFLAVLCPSVAVLMLAFSTAL